MPPDVRGMTESLSVDGFYEDRDGFIWFSTAAGLFRYDGHELFPLVSDPVNLNSLSSSRIRQTLQDETGVFWITTRDGGLNSYDPGTGKFRHFRHRVNDPESLSTDVLYFLQKDENGKLWVNSNFGMNCFDPKTGKNIRMLPQPGVAGQLQGNPWSPIVTSPGRVYVCTNAGFEYFDQKERRWHFLPMLDEKGDTLPVVMNGRTPPRSLCMDKNGLLWMGVYGREGLRVFDPKTGRLTSFDLRTADGSRIPFPQAILEDRSGQLWIASEDIWRISADRKKLERFEAVSVMSQQRQKGFNDLFQDRNGLLWFRNNQIVGPLFYAPQQETNKVIPLPASGGKRSMVGQILTDTDGQVWLMTALGVIRFNPATGEVRYVYESGDCYHFQFLGDDLLLVGEDRGLFFVEKSTGRHWPLKFADARKQQIPFATCAVFDHDGDLWYTAWGTGLIHISKNALDVRSGIAARAEIWKNEPANPNSLVSNLLQYLAVDAGNQIWVCGLENGLCRVDKSTRSVKRFMHEQGNKNSIRNNHIHGLLIDRGGDIWLISSLPLLQRFSPMNGRVTTYGSESGLPLANFTSIFMEPSGKIWANLQQTIISFDPSNGKVVNYPQVSAPSRFTGAIAVHPQSGMVYFGIRDDLGSFDPAVVKQAKPSPLKLARVSFYDAENTKGMLMLPEIRWKNTRLVLAHQQNNLEIKFVLLDYRSPLRCEFAYSLARTGNKPKWISAGNKNVVSFANLSPGNYVLAVRGRNHEGAWAEEPTLLRFAIRPPWFASWWAYLIYFAMAATAVGLFYRYRFQQKLVYQETLRLQEMDDFKSHFFTNITHEFRTPLTVILGMSERVLNEELTSGPPRPIAQAVSLIKRSGENLLRLVNQILDLSKLETNALKMNYIQGDVLAFIRYIAESLHSLANAQNLMLRVESDQAKIVMDYDPERFLQIIHNLLSNAIKFTPSGGKVVLQANLEGQYFHIAVTDSGAGIPPDELPHVFDRFFQARNQAHAKAGGTGIGLSLTRELVKVMGGEISVESKLGLGSTFLVKLPMTNNCAFNEKAVPLDQVTPSQAFDSASPSEGLTPSMAPTTQTVLLIEDNPDVVEYLNICLKDQFQLDFAYNGQAGIDKALETVPDLILSDVMMPFKDGFEVLEALKNDERTSHIPIIILTAKADVESRLTGLRRGADAYLSKPFHQEELLATLENLLETRRRLQLKYQQNVFLAEVPKLPEADPEDSFLQKVRAVVEKNLSDADFEMPQLERALAMSRSQIFRKIKALTGKSPSLFIRSIRLHHGKQMLLNTTLTVSEIAYEVGFTSLNYFSDAFFEEFGERPMKLRGG